MRVTVDVKGDETHELDFEELSDLDGSDPSRGSRVEAQPTYADLLRAVDLSPHEVSVLVDGRPVPEDQPVETDHVTVLRLIKGG
ncbi:ubiquitin-like small modifier protein SAMP2 [Natrarchaeobaculum aegyptiacum]|uniref:Sulfur transfer protein involved in thiamine biosynthesis n=1 Tax=Natrarchaeobaculum aegyptiacum TaxID=745377 RepID=A0A2Z2HW01_9EURY|nr:ubiquitin-like small modifier protein 2 [Natrarchaeobaculum aegyptiacum]ARS89717.1 sulfur transfer protein involved in thiamine biosynthesis [Natrarchaeobaculum aegyptiacum]